jgi:hypothetical protein
MPGFVKLASNDNNKPKPAFSPRLNNRQLGRSNVERINVSR